MDEEYKFPGFSTNISRYAEVERYCTRVLEEVIANTSQPRLWSIELYSEPGGREQSLKRIFAISPDAVLVRCRNLREHKGVRLQIEDPAANDKGGLEKWFGAPFGRRPAQLLAFADTSGEPTWKLFSKDLAVIFELSSRTEELARELLRLYLIEGLSYDEIGARAQALSQRETELAERWKVVEQR
jgi:hypothetical protein